MPIFVLGMHRSGTSALARLLQLAGCYGGPADGFEPADESNPTGYWERSDLHAVNEKLLAAAGGTWYDVARLDLAAVPAGLRRELDDEARRIVAEMEEHPPWVVKDPRMCALMPFWRRRVSDPRIVLIYRHPAAVARSLERRDGIPVPFGLALWEWYNRTALRDSAGLRRVLVSYENLVAAPVETTRQLLADLRAAGAAGLRSPEPAEILGFIDPGLRHHREPADGTGLRPGQRRLLAALADGSALDGVPAAMSERSLELLTACGQVWRYHRAQWKEHHAGWMAERGELANQRDIAVETAENLTYDRQVREAAWEEERRRLVARAGEAAPGTAAADGEGPAPGPEPASPWLSVVVVVYNMRREAPRTLQSLSARYQRRIDAWDYEVIVVENGSTEPLDPEVIAELGEPFRYFSLPDAPPSPARAVNFGVAQARGRHLGILIDGARIVTPGMLGLARDALAAFRRPVVSSLGFHLGPDLQMKSRTTGYSQEAEDALLAQIGWPDDGYRLFEIAALAGSSQGGWLRPLDESNCLFLPRELYDELGGFEEGFTRPGGGFVNLDFYARACRLPDSRLVMLLGEGSFHQVHGGAMTGRTAEDSARMWQVYDAEYFKIRGDHFETPQERATLFGELTAPAVPWMRKSCDLCAEAAQRAEVDARRDEAVRYAESLRRTLDAKEAEVRSLRAALSSSHRDGRR